MKKILLFIILIVVLTMTVGCQQKASPAPGFGHEDLYLNIDGKPYSLNINIETVIAGLGSDYTYSEAISCDYDGLDKTFIYDVAEFYTFPLPEGDVVNEIYTDSTSVSTSKLIHSGAAKEDVIAVYGQDCEDTGYQLIYRLPDSDEKVGSLCFDIENDMVKSIYITTQPV